MFSKLHDIWLTVAHNCERFGSRTMDDAEYARRDHQAEEAILDEYGLDEALELEAELHLVRERERGLREALTLIASCDAVVDRDVISIARAALREGR